MTEQDDPMDDITKGGQVKCMDRKTSFMSKKICG